ncbi:MAG: DUF3849 domain-containing protein [Oscillospiraceae bacterium]|nr:DUF3849 domain-containing protein [Oscillospiraceae bacterium]
MDELKETQEDTALDEYPAPDPSVSPTALEELGCERDDLLPMFADKARQLRWDLPIYAASPDNLPDMAFLAWSPLQYPPETVFAVPKREWEQSMAFHIALNERTGRQTQRERAFLRHTGDCFAVYQFRPETDEDKSGRVPLETARTGGLSPRRAGYELVYTAPLTGGDIEKLEKRFRERPPVDFHHRKIGVGDIIAVKQDGKVTTWHLDRLAFSELPGLFENVPLYRTGEHGERLPLTDEIPLYRETGEYAQARGELEAYFASHDANIACRNAIDKAVAEHYRDWCLDTASAVRQVRDEFGYERTLHVLAVAIRHYAHDGRISRDNILWAERFPLKPDIASSGFGGDRNIDFLILKTHLVLLDAFTKAARRDCERSRPLSEEDIVGEAERIFRELKKPEAPNGPDGKSFTAQFSPEFVARANEGDYVMLSSMMPFRSFEVTPMRDVYSGGIFARIAGNESRGPRRRLKQPVFKPRRPSAKKKKLPER